MTDDQKHLDDAVAALGKGLGDIEAEIAALKAQPPAADLDFTALDAAVARLTADSDPIVDPTPIADPPVDPTPAPDSPVPAPGPPAPDNPPVAS